MISIEQKKLEDFETLKESPAEVKLLVEIYERRIAELNAVIEKLLDTGRMREIPVPHMSRIGQDPLPVKGKIMTTSQLVAEMERRTKVGMMGEKKWVGMMGEKK